MSNDTNDVELKLPYWNDLLNELPQEEQAVHTAVRNAIQFQTGLESLSPAQFQDPEMVNNIQARMCELGKQVDVPVPDLTEAITTYRKDVVSQEGAKEVFFAVIKKIIDWLFAVVDWFKKTVKSFGISKKVQKNAASGVSKIIRKKVDALSEEKRNAPVIATVPARALVLFHTNKHTPENGFRYNAANLEESLTGVNVGLQTFVDAMLDEIAGASLAIDALADAILNDKQIDRIALGKINQHRKLRGLHHNGFRLIGFGLQGRPTSVNNPVRTEKTVVKNVARELGWLESGSFTFEASPNELVKLSNLAENQIELLDGLVGKLHNQLIFKKIEQRVSSLRKYADAMMAGSDLEPAHQQSLMIRLQAVQDTVALIQLNIQSTELFVRNYLNLLIGLFSASIQMIKED